MIRDRIKELRRVKASELFASPRNWRTHPQVQQDALQGILEDVGYADALLARELPDGTLELVDGHLRKETTPDQEVPVLILDIDEDEAKKLLAVLDPLAAMAEANTDALGSLLAEIGTDSEALQAMLDELASENGIDLFADGAEDLADPEPQVDRAAELQEEWGTETGQLWVIAGKAGEHRLLCGDSTKAEDVARLMDGETADAIVTDPPYGIGYRSNMKGSVARSIQGDEDTNARDAILLGVDEDLPIACFASWRCRPPRDVRGELIWKKNVGGMGDLTFPWSTDYEVVWIFGKGWKGHRGSSILEGETVVTWNTGSAARVHPHQKPIEVLAHLIGKSPGSVFDPFLGSGTTLIAAEQLGRKCYGMEISPAYCGVILQRMKDMGLEPTLQN